jgi:parallel beta-helix repeat protein
VGPEQTYTSIQSAINAASDGDTVLVLGGTYYENIDFLGKAITVRSENGPNVTIIDGYYNCCSVVTFNWGEDKFTVLEGFKLINGSGNTLPSWNDSQGGGIYCDSSSPKIINCIITNNTTDYGGGIYLYDSSPEIINCTINNNWAEYSLGGGIYCDYSSPKIINCTISDNSVGWYEGGFGGGIECYDNSSPEIINCTISSNTANDGGGSGIDLYDSSPKISKCIISGNNAYSGYGGGIYCDFSSPTITNSIISGNRAYYDGGGIYCDFSSPTITNCSISGNAANSSGGGIACYYSSSPTVINSILWGDAAGGSSNEIHLSSSSSIAITYSDFNPSYVSGSGSWSGSDNINAAPLVVNERPASEAPTSAGDYHLQSGSPCINVGTNDTGTFPNLPTDDIDGDSRPQGAGYDMGSDEYPCTDADGDGYYTEEECGTTADCDDTDSSIHPGAAEVCDALDNDCDGEFDEGCCSLKPDNINVAEGQNFTIPIRISAATSQVLTLGFKVTYDSSVLVYTGYTQGDLTTNFDFFIVNSPIPGTITIGGFESGGDVIAAGASGVVVNLNFTAGEPSSSGQCIEIAITNLEDDISNWGVCSGDVCYEGGCSHDGDVNEDGNITPLDALMAFQHYLEIITLNACQQAHADVNQSGFITPSDALCIFRKYLGQPSCLD